MEKWIVEFRSGTYWAPVVESTCRGVRRRSAHVFYSRGFADAKASEWGLAGAMVVSLLERNSTSLRAAIARSEDTLARMSAEARERGVCQCCVGAFYGGTEGRYHKLAAKIDRQRAWLAVLLAKRGQGDLRAACGRYQELARRGQVAR